MNISELHAEIDRLLKKIAQRYASFKDQEHPVSKIEIDILLSEVRTLYDLIIEIKSGTKISDAVPAAKYEKPEIKMEVKAPVEIIPERETVPVTAEEIQEEETERAAMPAAKMEHKISSSGSLFDEISTIADKFEDKPTLNEKLTEKKADISLASKIKKNPIRDLKSAIGINEKFIFLNELFDGDSGEYNEAIDKINSLSSFTEAEEYLRNGFDAKYNWKLRNKYVRNDFMELIQRRFL